MIVQNAAGVAQSRRSPKGSACGTRWAPPGRCVTRSGARDRLGAALLEDVLRDRAAVAFGLHTEQHATLLDHALVVLGLVLGNAQPDHATHHAAGRSARARAGQ